MCFSLYPTCPEKRAAVDFLLNWDMGILYGIAECIYPQLFHKQEEDPEKVKVNHSYGPLPMGPFGLISDPDSVRYGPVNTEIQLFFSNLMKNFNF